MNERGLARARVFARAKPLTTTADGSGGQMGLRGMSYRTRLWANYTPGRPRCPRIDDAVVRAGGGDSDTDNHGVVPGSE